MALNIVNKIAEDVSKEVIGPDDIVMLKLDSSYHNPVGYMVC